MKANIILFLGIFVVAFVGALLAMKRQWQQRERHRTNLDESFMNAGGYGVSGEEG